jgi:dihydroorotate dehydrogenase
MARPGPIAPAPRRGVLRSGGFAAKMAAMMFPLSALALPALRRLAPETAHAVALRGLRLGLAGHDRAAADPRFAQTVLGRHFPNPIGLAAGFDKNAVAVRPLMALGFGFVEIGTVTPLAQPGNPRPRLFRLEADRALINRLGFPGDGLARVLPRLAALGPRPVPLGANIGLNKAGAVAERDYPALAVALAPHVDYLTLNVSSPNTPGLRDLQAAERLAAILAAVARALPEPPPLLVKIAPDLGADALAAVVETALAGGVVGMIIANTTIARPPGLRSPLAGETGGLSGPPLRARAKVMLAHAARLAAGRLVLIGCGGIASGEDVLAMIRAGASLVQLYTAFVYQGAALLPRLWRELGQALDAGGFARLEDARGVDIASLVETSWNT